MRELDASSELEDLVKASPSESSWLDAPSAETDDVEVEEFDIVASPNDWNYSTIVNFIESGAMRIPTFQRNYVWDRRRASKLIESLIIGLPVPQVFLYEEDRNSFLVIDGQQRLLTLYFFSKGRFPKSAFRGSLRPYLAGGMLTEDLLADDELFEPFELALPKSPGGKIHPLHGRSYTGLGNDQTALNLRTIRNVVVKQTKPEGDAAVFEIFSRLNTGGVNLSQQEIRASLYHSELFDQVLELNLAPAWRRLVGQESPDARMRDTEFLLRGLALARGVDDYSGSMANFINSFCVDARGFGPKEVGNAIDSLRQFFALFSTVPTSIFHRAGKFSGVLFECVFAAWVRQGMPGSDVVDLQTVVEHVKSSSGFASSLQEGSTKAVNIKTRVRIAEDAISAESA